MITKWQDLIGKVAMDTGRTEDEVRSTIERYYSDVLDKLKNINLSIVYTPLGCYHVVLSVVNGKIRSNEKKIEDCESGAYDRCDGVRLENFLTGLRARTESLRVIRETTKSVRNCGITRIRAEKKRRAAESPKKPRKPRSRRKI